MTYEVEQKFPAPDAAAIERKLAALGVAPGEPQLQVDQYFGHPARDFAQTDEALRIRRIGERNFVTYKGPKLDRTTKTRREIELPLPPGEKGAADFAALLTALGFRPVTQVRKHRRKAHLKWQGHDAEAALDDVEGLGVFVELEIAADEEKVEHAKQQLAALAKELGLQNSERRSYLELLLEQGERS